MNRRNFIKGMIGAVITLAANPAIPALLGTSGKKDVEFKIARFDIIKDSFGYGDNVRGVAVRSDNPDIVKFFAFKIDSKSRYDNDPEYRTAVLEHARIELQRVFNKTMTRSVA